MVKNGVSCFSCQFSAVKVGCVLGLGQGWIWQSRDNKRLANGDDISKNSPRLYISI